MSVSKRAGSSVKKDVLGAFDDLSEEQVLLLAYMLGVNAEIDTAASDLRSQIGKLEDEDLKTVAKFILWANKIKIPPAPPIQFTLPKNTY